MAKTEFSQTELDNFLQENIYNIFRNAEILIANAMAVHADGVFPYRLLKERRPNESWEVFHYRELIFEPITKPIFSKVFSSLQKIRRTSEWVIQYSGLEEYTKIPDEESLEMYCEENFPNFTSVTNWAFSILLRKYLIDPNAVVFVFPTEFLIAPSEFLEPFPEIFACENVIYFKESDFCVLKSPDTAQYIEDGASVVGDTIYIVTMQSIFKYGQDSSERHFTLISQYDHNLGYMPCFKLGGVLIDQSNGQFLYESRIGAMIPELNEAIREYSDLQAAKVLHIYPERWEYMSDECTSCKGTGRRRNPFWNEDCNCEIEIECDKCHGHGYKNPGPFSKIMVKPMNPALNPQGQVPIPPAGFIEKDVKIITIQQASIDAHVANALSAINFDFLDEVPIAQSGVAKRVDQDELNNTVHSIAEDIVAIMDNVYQAIADYRYGTLYSDEDIEDMCPDIPVPQFFDLVNSQTLENELVLSRKNQANPIILNALEIDYAGKRFNDPTIRDQLTMVLELDPLPNMAETDKVLMLQNDGITQETYIISSNIQPYIQRAIEENPNFPELEPAEQKAIIQKFAQEQIAGQNAAVQVRSTYLKNGGTGLAPSGSPEGVLNQNNSDNSANSGANPIQPDSTGNIIGPNFVPGPNL